MAHQKMHQVQIICGTAICIWQCRSNWYLQTQEIDVNGQTNDLHFNRNINHSKCKCINKLLHMHMIRSVFRRRHAFASPSYQWVVFNGVFRLSRLVSTLQNVSIDTIEFITVASIERIPFNTQHSSSRVCCQTNDSLCQRIFSNKRNV